MKSIIPIFICGLFWTNLCAQTKLNTANIELYNSVAYVYHNNINSYLLKFVDMQYPGEDKEAVQLREIMFKIYKDKSKSMAKDYLEGIMELEKQSDFDSNKKYFNGVMELAYRVQFPGLDKAYFDKVEKEVASLK